MDNFKALPVGSQGNVEDVLFLNVDARPSELFEAATHRLESAREMMEVFAQLNSCGDDRSLPAISRAASLLLSDASGLFDALYGSIRAREDLIKDCAEMQAVVLQR
ncbi:hypothetical protein V2A89_02230 [Pseudomonas aeruginosa]